MPWEKRIGLGGKDEISTCLRHLLNYEYTQFSHLAETKLSVKLWHLQEFFFLQIFSFLKLKYNFLPKEIN